MYIVIRGPSSGPSVALRNQGDSPWSKPYASNDIKKKKKKAEFGEEVAGVWLEKSGRMGGLPSAAGGLITN